MQGNNLESNKTKLSDCIFCKRELDKASRLLMKCRRITRLYRSKLDNGDVSERLVSCMCEAFPEQAAVKKDKAWYASGCRV